MTQPPTPSGALRGAVDLSSLASAGPAGPSRPAAAPNTAGGQGSSGDAGPAGGILVKGSDAGFQEIILATRDVAALVVLWSSRHPETRGAIDAAVTVAEQLDGRLQVVEVDVETSPGVAQAFQVQQIPMTVGLVAGQPLPMFAGVSKPEQIRPVVDELLRVAAQHGVTGRVSTDGGLGGAAPAEPPPLPPLHQEAYDAIENGDLAGAEAAYRKALQESPADEDARIGLAQVQLLARTANVDLQAARAAAAAHPDDVDAQILVADLDLLGGHLEDAFHRLIDVVRRTAGDERERARQHLVELFDVTGPQDDRVVKARRALMSALF